MNIITDEHSAEVSRRIIAKHNARVKNMRYNFTPNTIAKFTVNMDDIFNIAPPKNSEEYMRRLTEERANQENTKKAIEFENSQKDIEIQQLRENLKNPNLTQPEAEELYKRLDDLAQSRIQGNDPQMIKKQQLIHKTIENEKRERGEIMRNYGFGVKDIHDQMRASTAIQRETVKKFGSIERGMEAMHKQLQDKTQEELKAQSEIDDPPLAGFFEGFGEEKGEEAEPERFGAEAGDDDIEVVGRVPVDVESSKRAVIRDADAYIESQGKDLKTKKGMILWLKYIKEKAPTMAQYEVSGIDRLNKNYVEKIYGETRGGL